MELDALNKLTYGIFVLTANQNGKDNGCIINTVEQVTAEPNRIAIAVNKLNYTQDMIQNSGKFCVSVLSEEADFELIKRFGFQTGKAVDKFEGFAECERAENGIYYITKGTNSYFTVDVEQTVDLGTHTMFIGKVKEMKVLCDVPSATYSYYHQHIKPQPQQDIITPKTVDSGSPELEGQ
ncbi:MAG: flavin reductase, partial [Lachnospiraceae bacterium]|nr:flavin reductase [Lachnospiraceae bacterium]